MTPEDAPSAPLLPDYELLRQIGRGSYGEVWLARGVTGVFRAVKIVWRNRFSDARPYEREFRGLKEFASISLVESRQLALLHVSRNETDGFFYYVMELADDVETGREINPERYVPRTLREVRARSGRLPAAECVSIGVELARGLAGMHARNLVHRDIKPSNVIFVGGVPKLADIGLVATASGDLTFVGTEGFFPPEGPGTPAADVYSLGKVLYELATGMDRKDFPRLNPHWDQAPDRKALLELNEVIIRACDPNPTRRFKDAQLILDELLLLQAGRSVRRMRATERRLARSLEIAAILAITAVVAGTGAWVEHTRLSSETARREKAESNLEDLARRTFYSASLSRAQRALELNDFGGAREALSAVVPAAGGPDLRGFEWRALWDESRGDLAEVVPGNGHSLEKIYLSPNGRLVAGQSDDDCTTLRDADTLKLIRTINGTHRLAGFSSDGEWLVGSDRNFALQRWRLADGIPDSHPASGVNRPVLAHGGGIIAVTADNIDYVSAFRDWDFPQHRDVQRLPLALEDYQSWAWGQATAITPDGKIIAIAYFHTKAPKFMWRLQVYDLEHHLLLHDEQGPDRITAVGFSGNGSRLAIANADRGEVVVQDTRSGDKRWQKPVDLGVVQTLAFSPNDGLLAIGGREPTIEIFDASTGALVNKLSGHEGGVTHISWSKTGETIYSAGTSGDLRKWAANSPTVKRQVSGLWAQTIGHQYACISDDGSMLAANTNEDELQVFHTRTFASAGHGLKGSVPLAFDADNQRLLALTRDGFLMRYPIGNAGSIEDLRILAPGSSVECADASSATGTLIAADTGGSIHFWDLASKRELGSSPAGQGRIWWAIISNDGEKAITAGRDLTVKLWSVRGVRELAKWSYLPRANYGSISHDRRLMAICLQNGEVEVRDLNSLGVVRRFKTDNSVLESIAFSHDDSRLFCGGSNGAIQIYETNEWRPIITLFEFSEKGRGDQAVTYLAVSRRNNTLLGYRADGVLRVWGYDQ